MKKFAPKNFEEAIAKLELILQVMQKSDLPLEEAFFSYEEGQQLLAFCRQKLAEVEQKLLVLEEGELAVLQVAEQHDF